MEDLNPELESTPEAQGCINCGNPDILHGYPNKLCASCRTNMIKFPIPLWVKLFGGGVVLIMLVALVWLPGNFNAAIHLSRAQKAEDHHEYLTEQRELEQAAKVAPNSVDVLTHLVIASFENSDFKTLYTASNTLVGKKIEDSAIYNRITGIIDETKFYAPDSIYNNYFGRFKNALPPDTAFVNYIRSNPRDIYAIYGLASVYLNQENYPKTDTLLSKLLAIHPGFIPALTMKITVKREMNQTDSSYYYSDAVLVINHQNLYALSAKARTLLKTHRNSESMKLAQQCYALDQNDGYNTATLAMIYHFNKDYKKRDEILARASKDSVLAQYMSYAQEVISNKVKFQN